MSMVDSMETSYSMHGHTRSLSSIASTILPLASNASTYTSVTASPMEPQDLDTLPIELKVPLPTSSCCSMEDLQALKEDLELSRNNAPPLGDRKSQDDSKGNGQQIGAVPILQHESKNENGRSETSNASNVSLDELARLVHAERFQRHRAISATAQLEQQSIMWGLHRRLSSTMMIAYGNLIDQYKGDDQAGFAGLYESLERVKTTCNADLAIGENELLGDDDDVHSEPSDYRPWTRHLPAEDRKCIVDFLTRLRTDPDYLANRIASLEPSELAALTSSYHPAGVDLSVLANHSHGMTQFYSQDSQMMKLSRRMDNLQHFHDQDPFFTLIYCLFDTMAVAGSLEYARRNDIWSTTCSKVIIDRRPGGDELIIAAADAFTSLEEWKLRPQIELYLQTVLSEGSFLLDPTTNVPLNPNESPESKNASHAVRVANFFENALDDLFQLIASAPHQEALPKTAQDFVQSTIRKIEDPQMQLRAKQFMISRWYFASFLSSVIVYPELQGLLMTHHIGDGARQNILKQIVIRMQAQVFDVLLSRADDMLVSLERRVQILAISNYFEPGDHDSRSPLGERQNAITGDIQAHQLTLSAQDLSGLVHTLYPVNPVPEKLVESLTVVQASAPPSTTSSSTLRPGSSEDGSRASSMGPNYSGSSVNSEVTITGLSPTSPQGIIDNLSNGLSRSEPPTATRHVSDADPDKVAWRLWSLHAKLQIITRTALDPSLMATSSGRWAVFPVHSSGRVSLNRFPMPSSELFASDENPAQSNRGAFNLRTLKKAIVALLADRVHGQGENTHRNGSTSSSQDPLRVLLEAALARARLSMKFGVAHYWHECLDIYSNLATSSNSEDFVSNLQTAIGGELQRSIDNSVKQAQASETLIRSLRDIKKQQRHSLATLEGRRNALRIKMWYISDVRHSSTYEEALLVTKALRAMATFKRNKQPGSTFSWARQRLRGALSQERADAQTLETMTASKGCGGRSKLADDQVEMTSRWLTRTGIENFCRGEERLHRFCYEVQKSVGKLAGASLLESPVLWSSHLYRREKFAFDTRSSRASVAPSSGPHNSLPSSYGGNWRPLAYTQSILPPMTSPVSVGAHAGGLGNRHGLPLNGQSTPTFSSISPASRPALPSIQSPYSMARNVTMSRPGPRYDHDDISEWALSKRNAISKDRLLRSIKEALYGLLASDLGYLLWDQGSETDAWIKKAATEEQVDEKSALGTVRSSLEVQTGEPQHNAGNEGIVGVSGQASERHEEPRSDSRIPGPDFGFTDGYQTILRRMSTTHDPSVKLEMFFQLEDLVVLSLRDSSDPDNVNGPPTDRQAIELQSEAMSRSKSVPRTKTTSLEEVVANCTERRAATLQATSSLNDVVSTDAIVNQLLTIFRDPRLRPHNLFLSLQYIAAFTPPSTLDHTSHGKAFWDCSLAALALKEDLCNSTVRRAAEITDAYITSKPTSPPYPSQQEAANMWLVAAKEGSPVAARELGLFYLTHPDLLPQRVTMPLSRTKDVFKSIVKAGDGSGGSSSSSIGGAGSAGEKERGTLDPLTFDVVHHWMEIAANGGDEVARTFLRQGGGHG